MNEYEFTLHYERTEEAPDGRAGERLQREVWDVLMDVFSRYLIEEGDVWPYLREMTIHGRREGWWLPEEKRLRFLFTTRGGEWVRSAAACAHWARRAAATQWRRLERVAAHSGARFTNRLDPAELLSSPEDLFVTYEGQAWLIRSDDGVPELVGDGVELAVDELPERAREEVETIVKTSRCGCRMCSRLRPDPQWEARWREDLASDDRSLADRAIHFLMRTVHPSTDAIVALAGASDQLSSYRHSRAMFELGQRLDASRAEDLSRALDDSHDSNTRAALIACIAGLPLDADERTSLLLGHAEAEAPAAETAVEFLGYGAVATTKRLEVAERLAELVGERDDLDYAVALTLYNLFREDDYPPSIVKETLRELARQSGEQADVAERALAWFDKR
jgi:hypothetical protein